MVRSDLSSVGVKFTMNTESDFKDALFITSCNVVSGMTDPTWEPVMKPAAAILTTRAGRPNCRRVLAEAGDRALVGLQEQRVQKADRRPRYGPDEENPMLGLRGAARYIAESFAECFHMTCAALKSVRDEMGLTDVEFMVSFVRTLKEAQRMTGPLAANGPERGENGLRLIMMCEAPSNAVLADPFLDYFDGISIGSNDLTQMTLGLDLDSGLATDGFDGRDPAVTALPEQAIKACRARGKYVGSCGLQATARGPSARRSGDSITGRSASAPASGDRCCDGIPGGVACLGAKVASEGSESAARPPAGV
jgi:phosphoenolpyruvate synthase/pyruvate phosphate dikinase